MQVDLQLEQSDAIGHFEKSLVGHQEPHKVAFPHRRKPDLLEAGDSRRGRRIDKNQADNVVALLGGKHAGVRAAEGMPDDNERTFFVGGLQQSIQLATDGFGVSRRIGWIAPAVAGPVIRTHAGRGSDPWLNPRPVQRSSAGSLFQDHRWRARAGAEEVMLTAINGDEPAGWRKRRHRRIGRCRLRNKKTRHRQGDRQNQQKSNGATLRHERPLPA
jgi:hypothetical protein